ncbi:MAG: YebC/PmpR family DNA-binding transcriptional regulator [Clostridiales bacterium]|nr:YebC/PmpR family DNA-binding transcriptional regulator [Clostridiales bacterium]
MSGHSKWHNIQAKKGKTDAARGKIFTKIGREIAVAVKMGGADPSTNSKLKDIIAKAKANNMPNDNITRSIKKASGDMGSVNYEEKTYEGYGIGGTAVIVRCLTDNINRTGGDVRHAFDKHGGNLGATGCVSYMFNRKGIIILEKTLTTDVDEVMMTALDCGALDVIDEEDCITVECEPNEVGIVAEKLEQAGLKVESSENTLVPDNYIDLDEKQLASFTKMLELLEDNDDVQEVVHNANLPEEEIDE